MPCFRPLTGYRSKTVEPSGKRRIVFSPQDGYTDMEITVPCGQCIGCRLERSRQWAIRCIHEAQLHEQNCFITLTYNDETEPHDGGLDKSHFQNFMKRLRRRNTGKKIRYYHCGEYGEQFDRPHYHACLFGHDFEDKYLFKDTRGTKLYRSPTLESLWPFGYSTIGEVTFESAAYCARYIMKKISGAKAEAHYQKVDAETGEIFTVQKEYTSMSLKPGIGSEWYKKFKTDCYPSDFIVVNGQKMRPPKYYDMQLEKENPHEFIKLKSSRTKEAAKHSKNNTYDRLLVREKVTKAKASKLKREI